MQEKNYERYSAMRFIKRIKVKKLLQLIVLKIFFLSILIFMIMLIAFVAKGKIINIILISPTIYYAQQLCRQHTQQQVIL